MPEPAFPDQAEFVVQENGQVRQAGATTPEGEWVIRQKAKAERSLFFFARSINGMTRLTRELHLPVCNFLQRVPPYRKLLLIPRDHLKTSITSRSLPIHMLIQPQEANIYFPGKPGTNTRILLANEKAEHAENQLRAMKIGFEGNQLLRAFWPNACWDNPKREAPKWTEGAITLPRTITFPEASIETIGVGGVVTGRHYDVIIKDDLVTREAANSATIMADAINWHKTSRALFDDAEESLEFIIGTRWAVYDLYQEILDKDHSVEVLQRAAIENDQPIYPRQKDPTTGWSHGFTMKALNQLKEELGPEFFLLYMNTPYDPELVDFDMAKIRTYDLLNAQYIFAPSPHDEELRKKYGEVELAQPEIPVGTRLTPENHHLIFGGRHVRNRR